MQKIMNIFFIMLRSRLLWQFLITLYLGHALGVFESIGDTADDILYGLFMGMILAIPAYVPAWCISRFYRAVIKPVEKNDLSVYLR